MSLPSLSPWKDHANREQIIPLLRYHSSKSGEAWVIDILWLTSSWRGSWILRIWLDWMSISAVWSQAQRWVNLDWWLTMSMVLMRWCILMYQLDHGKTSHFRCWMIDEPMNMVFSLVISCFVGFTEFLRSTAYSIHHRKDQEGCSTISLHRGQNGLNGCHVFLRALNKSIHSIQQGWKASRMSSNVQNVIHIGRVMSRFTPRMCCDRAWSAMASRFCTWQILSMSTRFNSWRTSLWEGVILVESSR